MNELIAPRFGTITEGLSVLSDRIPNRYYQPIVLTDNWRESKRMDDTQPDCGWRVGETIRVKLPQRFIHKELAK